MEVAGWVALFFLLIFVAWLFSPTRGGGHQPPKNTHPRPHKPPPKPSDACAAHPGVGLWVKPVAPPDPADRPKGLPPRRHPDSARLERIFDEADGALPQDAGALLNLIREIETERR